MIYDLIYDLVPDPPAPNNLMIYDRIYDLIPEPPTPTPPK